MRARPSRRPYVLCLFALTVLLTAFACKRRSSTDLPGLQRSGRTIQNIGSDTMVNLAQAWAEAYAEIAPEVSVEVSGGGSGVGVASLINGTADIANCSRAFEPEETAKAKAKTGKEPKQFTVGFDGLAVFVHKDNPLDEISVEQLRELYREHGRIERWSQLGVGHIPGAKDDRIIRVSRQNNSGTYQYFRETVVGNKADFKQGSLDMNGSKEVVELISHAPGAIGYSGLGYATPAVKVLKVAQAKAGPAVMPSIQTVHDQSYPIARPLYMYTTGEPKAETNAFMDWVLSEAGQKIVKETGYVPLSG